jgi:uncharacterized paraquat-inducible protein A
VNNTSADTTGVGASVILNDRLSLSAGAMVLAVLAGAAWALFGGASEETERYTHMHCSACQEEFPYVARLAGARCAVCEKGIYIATVGSVTDNAGAIGAGPKMAVFALIAAVLVQGWVYLAVVRGKALRQERAAARRRTLVCRCPYCRRKIGFPASQEGAGGVCPRCKTAFVFTSLRENNDSLETDQGD